MYRHSSEGPPPLSGPISPSPGRVSLGPLDGESTNVIHMTLFSIQLYGRYVTVGNEVIRTGTLCSFR